MARITVLGMGAMGSRMAMQLLKAGHAVTVWNRTPDKTLPLVTAGAKTAASPRAAVADAEFAIGMLRDDAASRQVWLQQDTGALAGLPKQALAIESSTVTVAWAQELHQAGRALGIACLDAPVAGSRPQAEAAQLIHLVGGEATAVAKATPILAAMGGAIHHAGPAGSGAAVKLAINTLLGVQLAALAELIGYLQRSGLDTAKAVDIVTSTPVCSPAAKAAAGAMLARNFAPMFPIELVEKDFAYALDSAATIDAPLPMAQAARRVLAQAMERGYGGDNITGLARLYL